MPEATTAVNATDGARPRWRRLAAPLALAIVLAIALAIAAGVGQSTPSNASRTASLEALIRCPSCEDLSVAEASSSAAIAARHQIAAMVAAGRSNKQILASFVSRYGLTILLKPGTSGLIALVWVLPLVGGTAALCTVGIVFWRRHRAFKDLGSSP